MRWALFLVLILSLSYAEEYIGWIRADSTQCHNNVDSTLRTAYQLCTLNCQIMLDNIEEQRACNTRCSYNLLKSNLNTERYGSCKSGCFNKNSGDRIIACYDSCANDSDQEGCFSSCYSGIDTAPLNSCVNNCYSNYRGKVKNIYDYSHLFCDSMLTIGLVTGQEFNGALLYPLEDMDDYYISSGWFRGAEHRGIDYVPNDESTDHEIISSTPGTISRIERHNSNLLNGGSLQACINRDSTAAYGNRIHVRYEDENGMYEVVYGHFKEIYVSLGEEVSAGDVLGIMGNTGCSTATHLHFEVRLNGDANRKVDPYDIYSSKENYPQFSNDYDRDCGPESMWEVCPGH